ncbi:MAG: ATP-binding protein [Pseudomonadota bacterium]
MMEVDRIRTIRISLALLLPFVICAVQWQFWPVFRPFVWFLFFPAVFFSSRIGGKFVGLVSTAISALLVVYFFIPPQLSFSDKAANNLYSVALFLVMGGLFSLTHDKLEKAKLSAANALEESRVANELLQKSNQQVTQLYEQTLRLDELKTQFFANISHELRTPLTLILGPLRRRLADPGIRDEDRGDLEVVERNARLLYRQVSDLLDVAKLEAGRMEPRYSNVDLAGLVRFVASHFESRAGENNIDFSIEASGALPAQVDPEKCRRILLNLLANAFKFTPAGGGIVVILRTCNGSALIEVRDNGPGIPADKRELVFERFSQIDGGSERRYGGTGLGLAIVKEFTRLHGGSVKVTDAPGGGALFTVTLPLTAPDGATIHALEERGDELFEHLVPADVMQRSDEGASVVACDAPLVLVVEDNRDMNRYISSLLARQYRVASAFDGEEGLERARSLQPDLLISDMMMPRMSGERMVRELRSQSEMDRLPIIMLSAKSDDELRVRLLENGVQDYLTKPFSDAELLARVGGFLAERRRNSEELRESETRFETTFELAAVGIALVAPDGRWLRVNRALCDIVGYSSEELLAKTFLELTHPDDLETDLDHVRSMLARERDSYSLEKRYFRKDGLIVWVNLTVALVWTKDGAPDYFISVIEDIEARKDAEETLSRNVDELRRFDRASVGREEEMITLKKRINELSRQCGLEPPFDLSFLGDAESPTAGEGP